MSALSEALGRLGISSAPQAVWIGGESLPGTGSSLTGRSPIDGATLTTFASAGVADVPRVLSARVTHSSLGESCPLRSAASSCDVSAIDFAK